MIVHETVTHQMTVEFKLLQVQLWLSIMNQSPNHNGSWSTENMHDIIKSWNFKILFNIRV